MKPVQPLTEQRYVAALTALLAGGDSFDELLSDSTICAYRLAPNGMLMAASPGLLELLGYDSLDAMRAGVLERTSFDPVYAEATFARYGGKVLEAQTEWRRADGVVLAVRESARAVYGPARRPRHYDGLVAEVLPSSLIEHGSADATPRPTLMTAAGQGDANIAEPEGANTSALQVQPAGLPQGTTELVRVSSAPTLPPSTADDRESRRTPPMGSAPAISMFSGAGGGPMELLAYWKIIRKRLWLIILLMLLGGSGAAYYAMQIPPRYSSTTTLYLNPAAATSITDYQVDGLQALAATYAEFLKTSSFAKDVAQELGGTVSEGAIIGSLSTQYVSQTQFFRITATSSDAQSAQTLANTAAKVLIAKNIARQQEQQEQILQQSQPNPEREQLEQVRASLQEQLDLYNQQIDSLQNQLKELSQQTVTADTQKQVATIQQQLVSLQSLRQSALSGLADAQSALANSAAVVVPNIDTAVVVDVAPLPALPQPVRIEQYVLLALLVALSIGGALAFMLEYLDYTVKTPEALDAAYGIATQGVIGLAGSSRSRAAGHYQLVAANDPRSSIAEAFRALRTNIQVAGMSQPIRSLLITSAGPGEGKTFVAANLAVSLAQSGLQVLLVDADLRRPRVHLAFNLPRELGLTNVLLSQPENLDVELRSQVRRLIERARNAQLLRRRYPEMVSERKTRFTVDRVATLLDEVETDDPALLNDIEELRAAIAKPDVAAEYIQSTSIENLRVLASGPLPPNPAELLSSPRAIEVLESLSDYADIVIFDTPPAATVTDATILAGKVDAVLQVVRAGKTRIDLMRRCRNALSQVGARVLGPVLNQVRSGDMGYYANYYTYGYYGEGPGNDKPGKGKGKGQGKGRPATPVAAPKTAPVAAASLNADAQVPEAKGKGKKRRRSAEEAPRPSAEAPST